MDDTTHNSDDPEEIILFGVRHTDTRLEDVALEIVSEPVDAVFHERPPNDPPVLKYSAYSLLRNPLGIIMGIFSMVVHPARITRGSAANSSCQDAAKLLAEEYDCEPVEYIGMGRIERLQNYPWMATALNWVGFLMVLYSVFLAVISSSVVFGVVQIMIGVSAAVGLMEYSRREVTSIRDEQMYENIVKASKNRGADCVAIVVGENHVQGIATQAQAAEVDVDAQWVSSALDEGTDPSS